MDSSLVSRDLEIMSGALCFTGTRVPVKSLFEYLEGSSSLEEFLEDFPSVSRERAVAVLEAARSDSLPMRLLLDASVPGRLRRALSSHEVRTHEVGTPSQACGSAVRLTFVPA
jgi:uncharacterized protein (DUF433 family)